MGRTCRSTTSGAASFARTRFPASTSRLPASPVMGARSVVYSRSRRAVSTAARSDSTVPRRARACAARAS